MKNNFSPLRRYARNALKKTFSQLRYARNVTHCKNLQSVTRVT